MANQGEALQSIYTAACYAGHAIEVLSLKIQKHFRDYAMNVAAQTAENYFKLPSAQQITEFHMPTIGARANSDHIQYIERGNITYKDPLYECTRINAHYDEKSECWKLKVQQMKVFESELEAGIEHENIGRIKTYECENAMQALHLAKFLFDNILFSANDPFAGVDDYITKKVLSDHHPENSIMHNIASHINQCSCQPSVP